MAVEPAGHAGLGLGRGERVDVVQQDGGRAGHVPLCCLGFAGYLDEVAAASGLTTKTIRFYEQAGLLPAPPRTAGGYRDYPGRPVRRLAFIRDARCAGLTLAEIRSVLALRDADSTPCAHVTALIHRYLADMDQRLAELRATKAVLHALAERAAMTDPADCTNADVCRILTEANGAAQGGRRHCTGRMSLPSAIIPGLGPADDEEQGHAACGRNGTVVAEARAR